MNTLVACENEQLLDAALQVYARSCMYGTESQHVAAMKYRAEILRRLNTQSPAVSPPSVVAVSDEVSLPPLPSPASYDPGRFGLIFSAEQMTAYARAALESFASRMGSGERDEWLPIESCPYSKHVYVLMPDMGAWASREWLGIREGGDSRNFGHDEQWKIATPITADGKQLWLSIDAGPLAWRHQPSPNNRTSGVEREC